MGTQQPAEANVDLEQSGSTVAGDSKAKFAEEANKFGDKYTNSPPATTGIADGFSITNGQENIAQAITDGVGVSYAKPGHGEKQAYGIKEASEKLENGKQIFRELKEMPLSRTEQYLANSLQRAFNGNDVASMQDALGAISESPSAARILREFKNNQAKEGVHVRFETGADDEGNTFARMSLVSKNPKSGDLTRVELASDRPASASMGNKDVPPEFAIKMMSNQNSWRENNRDAKPLYKRYPESTSLPNILDAAEITTEVKAAAELARIMAAKRAAAGSK